MNPPEVVLSLLPQAQEDSPSITPSSFISSHGCHPNQCCKESPSFSPTSMTRKFQLLFALSQQHPDQQPKKHRCNGVDATLDRCFPKSFAHPTDPEEFIATPLRILHDESHREHKQDLVRTLIEPTTTTGGS
jgi:hypothetical protein